MQKIIEHLQRQLERVTDQYKTASEEAQNFQADKIELENAIKKLQEK